MFKSQKSQRSPSTSLCEERAITLAYSSNTDRALTVEREVLGCVLLANSVWEEAAWLAGRRRCEVQRCLPRCQSWAIMYFRLADTQRLEILSGHDFGRHAELSPTHSGSSELLWWHSQCVSRDDCGLCNNSDCLQQHCHAGPVRHEFSLSQS